jgi:hypothetical protein
MTATDTCAAKTGEPGAMRECGQRVVYLAAGERGNLYSGWHHEAPADHHAVPRAWVS